MIGSKSAIIALTKEGEQRMAEFRCTECHYTKNVVFQGYKEHDVLRGVSLFIRPRNLYRSGTVVNSCKSLRWRTDKSSL